MEAELKALLTNQNKLKASLEKLEKEWCEACANFYDQQAEITKKIQENEIEIGIIMRTMTTPIT